MKNYVTYSRLDSRTTERSTQVLRSEDRSHCACSVHYCTEIVAGWPRCTVEVSVARVEDGRLGCGYENAVGKWYFLFPGGYRPHPYPFVLQFVDSESAGWLAYTL